MSKKYTINELLEFVNRFSIESSLSWKIGHLYREEIDFEMYWIYDKSTLSNWYIKKSIDKDWLNMTSTELVKYLVEQKIDLVKFELQLLRDICMQAVCSHYFVLKASELIGEDKVNASIEVMVDLMKQKQLEKEVKENTKVKIDGKVKTTKLKLVKKVKKESKNDKT